MSEKFGPYAGAGIGALTVGTLALAAFGISKTLRFETSSTTKSHKEKSSQLAPVVMRVTSSDVGGYLKEKQKLRSLVEPALRRREYFTQLGSTPPRGILINGPSGSGKKMMSTALTNECGGSLTLVSGIELVNSPPEYIEQLFIQLREDQPAVLFIEDFDQLWQVDPTKMTQLSPQLCLLLFHMDQLSPADRVVVIASSSKQESVPGVCKKIGRFDYTLIIGMPSRSDTEEILRLQLGKLNLSEEFNPTEIRELSKILHGYVGADITRLCNLAAIVSVNQYSDQVTMHHFKTAMKEYRPAAIRDRWVEKPDVKWDDIGGLDPIRKVIEQVIEYPLKYRALYKKFGIPRKAGVLLFGPPGCGKTMVAKAIANECQANFLSLQTSELLSKYYSESASNVRAVFDNARAAAPCIIFFDEFDSVAKARGSSGGSTENEDTRIVNEILTQMDGLGACNDVFVIAATNRPNLLDPAVLRAGRLDCLLFLDLPDKESRTSILDTYVRKAKMGGSAPLDMIAQETDGCTGADLANIYRQAFHVAIQDCLEKGLNPDNMELTSDHFHEAMKHVRRSVTDFDIESCREFNQEHGHVKHKKTAVLPNDVV